MSPRCPCCPASWPRAPAPCYHRLLCCHLLLRNLLKFSESPRRYRARPQRACRSLGLEPQSSRSASGTSALCSGGPSSLLPTRQGLPGFLLSSPLPLLFLLFLLSFLLYLPFLHLLLSLSSSSTFSYPPSPLFFLLYVFLLLLELSEGCRASPSCWGWVCRSLWGLWGCRGPERTES